MILSRMKNIAAASSAGLMLALLAGCAPNASGLLVQNPAPGPGQVVTHAVADAKSRAAACNLMSTGLQLPIKVDAALFRHNDPKVRDALKKITATNVAHQCACIDHIPGLTPERRAEAVKQCQ